MKSRGTTACENNLNRYLDLPLSLHALPNFHDATNLTAFEDLCQETSLIYRKKTKGDLFHELRTNLKCTGSRYKVATADKTEKLGEGRFSHTHTHIHTASQPQTPSRSTPRFALSTRHCPQQADVSHNFTAHGKPTR